jgi:hypothetical protein
VATRESLVALVDGCEPISSQLPIRFGAECWESFEGSCSGCQARIPAHWLRGTVTRPLKTVAVVDAAGYCKACNLLTPFNYRIHKGGRLSGIKGGRWHEWQASGSVAGRLRQWLHRALQP